LTAASTRLFQGRWVGKLVQHRTAAYRVPKSNPS
jgi:hypothetical protein